MKRTYRTHIIAVEDLADNELKSAALDAWDTDDPDVAITAWRVTIIEPDGTVRENAAEAMAIDDWLGVAWNGIVLWGEMASRTHGGLQDALNQWITDIEGDNEPAPPTEEER